MKNNYGKGCGYKFEKKRKGWKKKLYKIGKI